LSGTAAATSSATLIANAKALSEIRALEEKAKGDVAAANTAAADATAQRGKKKQEVAAKNIEISNTTDPAKLAALKAELADLQSTLTTLEAKSSQATTELALKQDVLADYSKARAAIEAQQDSASTSASASATGTASFGANAYQASIQAQSMEKISVSVKDIVTTVLKKNYITETCVAVLTNSKSSLITGSEKDHGQLVDQCLKVIQEAAKTETTRLNAM